MAGPIGRYFEGEATSEVGLRSGAGEDFWTAFQPDLSTLDDDDRPRQPPARRPAAATRRASRSSALAEAATRADPPPATFRVIVNPLVIWIWIGALVALRRRACWRCGRRPRPAAASEAAYAARVGRELGTARPPS